MLPVATICLHVVVTGDAARPGPFSGAGTNGSQNRIRRMRCVSIVFPHDNAHAALRTQQLLQRFHLEMFPHPFLTLLLATTICCRT
ncbi:hypothetical protein AVEN_43915-1 [Araneus ventricosus]|uniref:Uncharacterized protein n=1 Tax=Araneus ventricosus TaxID=182803 RepID=A0A4Y2WNH9_ARAVE|nr:hypothetical protein AVEN_43915-1 [Araneus ventricosus]